MSGIAIQFVSAVPPGLLVKSATPSTEAFVGAVIDAGVATVPFGGPVVGWALNGLVDALGLFPSSQPNPFTAIVNQLNVIQNLLNDLTNGVNRIQNDLAALAQQAALNAYSDSVSKADAQKNILVVQYDNMRNISNQYAKAFATTDSARNQEVLLAIKARAVAAADEVTATRILNYTATLNQFNDIIAPSGSIGTIALFRNYLFSASETGSVTYSNLTINAMWELYYRLANIQIQGLQTLIEGYHTPTNVNSTTPRDVDAAVALTKTYYNPDNPSPNGIINQQRSTLLPPTRGEILTDRVVISNDVYSAFGVRTGGVVSPNCRMWTAISPLNHSSNNGFAIPNNRASALWWPRSPANGSFADAIQTLNTQRYGGYSDWRLPSPEEVSFLLTSRAQLNKPINAANFLNQSQFQPYFSRNSHWVFALSPDGGGNPRIWFLFPTADPILANGVALTINPDGSTTPLVVGEAHYFQVSPGFNMQFSGPVPVYAIRTPTAPSYPVV